MVNPAIIDTLSYSGMGVRDLRANARIGRDGITLFEHDLAFVRFRSVTTAPGKPTIVVLPDSPATIESYDNFVETVSADYNVVLLEIPGFGFSYPKVPGALGFEETSQIIATAISELPNRDIILVGPCFQGLIAIRVAEIIPNHLRGIIVAQSGDFAAECSWCDSIPDPKQLLRRPFIGQIEFREDRERLAIDWWSSVAAGPLLPLEDFQSVARDVMRRGSCYALATFVQELHSLNPPPALHTSLPAEIM